MRNLATLRLCDSVSDPFAREGGEKKEEYMNTGTGWKQTRRLADSQSATFSSHGNVPLGLRPDHGICCPNPTGRPGAQHPRRPLGRLAV
jgi:hypothetical protein